MALPPWGSTFESPEESSGAEDEDEEVGAHLQINTLEDLATFIEEWDPRSVICMVGAGLSTAAGIPDFRSPGTGLYDNLQRYDLPQPEAVFDLEFFRESPGAFYDLAKELWPTGKQYPPTDAHYFIKLLEQQGRLLRCYTQNIDMLEQLAGLSDEKVVAAHGNFAKAHTLDGREVPIGELEAAVFQGIDACLKLSSKYGGLAKPDIVFFGENLPEGFHIGLERDFPNCDLLLVLGTSLAVAPFNQLIAEVPKACARVLVNRQVAGLARPLNEECAKVRGGFRFESKHSRDLFLPGDCDAVLRELCERLGWSERFRRLCDPQRPLKPPTGGLPVKDEEEEEPTPASRAEALVVAERRREEVASPAVEEVFRHASRSRDRSPRHTPKARRRQSGGGGGGEPDSRRQHRKFRCFRRVRPRPLSPNGTPQRGHQHAFKRASSRSSAAPRQHAPPLKQPRGAEGGDSQDGQQQPEFLQVKQEKSSTSPLRGPLSPPPSSQQVSSPSRQPFTLQAPWKLQPAASQDKFPRKLRQQQQQMQQLHDMEQHLQLEQEQLRDQWQQLLQPTNGSSEAQQHAASSDAQARAARRRYKRWQHCECSSEGSECALPLSPGQWPPASGGAAAAVSSALAEPS